MPAPRPLRRACRCLALGFLLAGALLGVSACGPAEMGTPAPTATAMPDFEPPPPRDPIFAQLNQGKLGDFEDRCVGRTKRLDKVSLVYDDTVELTLRTSQIFRVAVGKPGTVDEYGPAQGVLRIACTIEARLVASEDVLDISPPGWAADRYTPPDPTTWSWVVTSRSTRPAEAVLQLKPVIRVTRNNGDVSRADLRTEDYPVTFTTTDTVSSRASAAGRWVAGAATGLGAVLALVVTVRSLRRDKDTLPLRSRATRAGRRPGRAPSPGPGAEPPSAGTGPADESPTTPA